VSATDSTLGVCVQTHLFASNSTPCADTDNNACTTAGCNGQGTCDQAHQQKIGAGPPDGERRREPAVHADLHESATPADDRG